MSVVDIDRFHQLAVNIELELGMGAVAYSHWTRISVSAEVVESFLFQMMLAANPVHDLKR